MGDLLTAKQNFIEVGGEAEHGQTKNPSYLIHNFFETKNNVLNTEVCDL